MIKKTEKNKSNQVIITMQKSYNVLFLSYDGLTDPLGQSQILPYLSKLSELNYNITIVSAEKSSQFDIHQNKIQKICDDNNICWEPISYTAKPPILSTIRDIITLKKKVIKLKIEKDIKIIHCRSYISALIGLFMKRKFNIKFIFDMRGFWADERIDGNIWNKSNILFSEIYNFFKKKEIQFLEESDYTISLTINGKKEIESWKGLKTPKFSVIPCCADLDHFDYNKYPKNLELKDKLGIPKINTVYTYLGSIGTWYMLDEMLDFFLCLIQTKPNSTFLFITKDDPQTIYKVADSKKIDRKHILIKPSERENLPNLLSICDAAIFFILPAYSKKASSPTKQAELLGMGIPLICNSNVGDTDEIIAKEKAGMVLKKVDLVNFKNAIQDIDKILSIDKSYLRNIAIKHFSLQSGFEKYKKVYDELAQ